MGCPRAWLECAATVEDLATRRIRAIDADRLLGRGHVLAEMPPAWLSDGRTVALLVTRPATLTSSPARAESQPAQGIRMIVVHAPADHPLSGERVVVAHLRSEPELLWNGGGPGALLAASLGRAGVVLNVLRLYRRRALACPLLTIHGGLVAGFDESGRRLLYLVGSSPPALWRATIRANGLGDARRLLKNADLGAVAW